MQVCKYFRSFLDTQYLLLPSVHQYRGMVSSSLRARMFKCHSQIRAEQFNSAINSRAKYDRGGEEVRHQTSLPDNAVCYVIYTTVNANMLFIMIHFHLFSYFSLKK